MRKLMVFNSITLDGYFTDQNNDISWAHKQDPEFNKFIEDNASSRGELLFGRVTYEMMKAFWPTDAAAEAMPVVADAMNRSPKVVFSTTMDEAEWENTRVVSGDIVAEVKQMKEADGPMMVLMGSGTIVAQLTDARLIDEYQMVVNPLVLGDGRTMFDGIKERFELKLTKTREFENGNVLMVHKVEQAA